MKPFCTPSVVRPFTWFLVIILSWAARRADAQCGNAFFYEDFETGSIAPTWSSVATTTAVTWTVNAGSSTSGSFQFQMTGLTSHFGGIAANFAPSTPTYVSWYIKPQHGSYACNYFVLGDASVSYSHCLVFCLFMSGTPTLGDIVFLNNNSQVNFPVTPNQWHHIELKNISFSAQTTDIWINNTLFQTGFQFRSPGLANVSRVHLYNLGANGTSIWDEIMIGDGLYASVSMKKPDCHGGVNGSSTVSAVGGTAPFTYSWSNTATTQVVSTLSAGLVYTVLVTDANSCTATKTLMLQQPTALNASFFTQSVSCFGGSNGNAAVSANGGTGPYSYTWSATGSTSNIASGLTAGTYSVLVSDALNCQASFSVGIAGPAPITSSPSSTPVACFGGSTGIAHMQSAGGTGVHSYTWSTGGSGPQKNNLSAGVYTCMIKDQNGCANQATVAVTEPAQITAQVSGTNITCVIQGAGQVNAAGGTPPFTFSWKPSGGSSQTAQGLSAGVHSVSVTDAKGCVHTVTLALLQDVVSPTVTIGTMNELLCKGDAATLSLSTNGNAIAWSTGSPGTTISVTPTLSTVYSATVTSAANGCTASASYLQMVAVCAGSAELSDDLNEISVYPVPAAAELHLRAKGAFIYELLSADGKKIREGYCPQGTATIGMAELAPGVYFLLMRTGDRVFFERLIRQ